MTTYFDSTLPPIARAGNPATSQLAATEITESGERQTLMRLALRHVKDHPGQTAGEIGDAPSERSSPLLPAGGALVV